MKHTIKLGEVESMLDEFIASDSEKAFHRYQEISNGKDSICAYSIEEDPFMVGRFGENVRGYSYD